METLSSIKVIKTPSKHHCRKDFFFYFTRCIFMRVSTPGGSQRTLFINLKQNFHPRRCINKAQPPRVWGELFRGLEKQTDTFPVPQPIRHVPPIKTFTPRLFCQLQRPLLEPRRVLQQLSSTPKTRSRRFDYSLRKSSRMNKGEKNVSSPQKFCV